MPTIRRISWGKSRTYARATARLYIEQLEQRMLPAGWPGLTNPIVEVEPNDTLDQAQSLGDLTLSGKGQVVGTIGSGATGAADVDWYSFTLDRPASVTLTTLDRQANSPFVSVLGLYNNDVGDFNDLYDPLGHRLVAQDDGALHGGDASIDRSLAAGTYYVAVSGSGNRYFNPLIAGSGYPGSTGNYGLLITATDLGIGPNDGPVVLATDPAANAALDRSPFVIRVDFSTAIKSDPNSVVLGQNVQLFYNATGTFGGTGDVAINLASYNFSPVANELQLTPAAPLGPGYYELILAGDSSANASVLRDLLTGKPLGENALHPFGQDFTATFHITGNEGIPGTNAPADDTAATAHQLGDLSSGQFVQVAGAIGDDSTDTAIPFNPSDVDLYHFQISGTGRYSFQTEVFAGRIGSPLDPAVSLFRLDPTDNLLHFVAANDDTLNNTVGHDGTPFLLALDSYLFAGLTAGDYYVAVSSSGNVFDPNSTHSGSGGFTTGDYVLNLLVEPDNVPPQVVSVTLPGGTALTDGAVLTTPPTGFNVHFSEPVNLTQLAQQNFLQTGLNQIAAVFVQGPGGTNFYPSFISYPGDGSGGTFQMLDALPNGTYVLHLSGSQGLTDLAGNPLVGNDPISGDYVSHFTVNGPVRGTPSNPLVWLNQEPNDTLAQPQVLGALFPNELQTGVTLERNSAASSPADTADYYQIQVLQQTSYFFILTGSSLPRGIQLTLTDSSGSPLPVNTQVLPNGIVLWAVLNPGTYVAGVGGWSPRAANVSYQLTISIGAAIEPPPPLTIGPGPTIRFRQVASVPLPPTPSTSPSGSNNGLPTLGSLLNNGSRFPVVSNLPNNPLANPTGVQGFQDISAISAGVLLALGAGPISGAGAELASNVASKPDAYERVLALAPGSPLSETIGLRQTALQSQHSGTDEDGVTPGSLTALLAGAFHQLNQFKFNWAGAVEIFYHLRALVPQLPLGSHGQMEKLVLPETSIDVPSADSVPGDPDSEEGTFLMGDPGDLWSLEGAGAQALALAAALAVVSPKRQRTAQESAWDDRDVTRD